MRLLRKNIARWRWHNDLDIMLVILRAITLFEMLGNFSFGDYFKEEAIFMLDFLTKELGIRKEKLLVTVYHSDDEATQILEKIANLSDEKIIKIATDDNFWSMEMLVLVVLVRKFFMILGDKIFGGPSGSKMKMAIILLKFWNLVFMQFEKQKMVK